VYAVVGTICAYDKRGKEAYFAEYKEEMDLATALKQSMQYPKLILRTDNWGYFKTAYDHVQKDSGSYWASYNCFLLILSTIYVTAPLWT
jgi:hypothetical protein